jgi:hypothetical protein
MAKRFSWGGDCAVGKWWVNLGRRTRLSWGCTEVGLIAHLPSEPCLPTDIKWTVDDRCRLPIKQAEREELSREYGGSPDDQRGRAWSYDTPPELRAEALHVIDHVCRERPAMVCLKMAVRYSVPDWDGGTEETLRLHREWKALADKCMGLEPVNVPPEETVDFGEEGLGGWGELTIEGKADRLLWPSVVITGGRPPKYELMPGSEFTKVRTDDGTRWTTSFPAEGGELEGPRLRQMEHAAPLHDIEPVARDYFERHRETLFAAHAASQRNEERRDHHMDKQCSDYVRPKGGFKKKRIATSVDVHERSPL